MTDVEMVKKEEEEEEELFWGTDDESEDELLETTTRSGKKAGKKPMLNFGEVLKAPLPTRYSCEALRVMIDKGLIDLEPEYQRGVVWSVLKQSAVIDSIFRNYYVPPVLFSIHVRENEDGDNEDLRICVDGKQRLSSIHLFMTNKIPLREPITNKAYWYKKPPKGRARYILTEKQREKFDNIQINCIEYTELDEEKERDMFQRVQMGVTLTPAEKLSANLGLWPDFVRELVKRYVENDSLNLRHVIKMDRGKDFMYMAQISLLILHQRDKNFTPNSTHLTKFLKEADLGPTETQKKQIIGALAKLTALSNDDAHNTPVLPLILPGRAAKPISPMEFLFAGYMCFRFSQANHQQLSRLIDGMMRRVRGEHSDVMINTRVEATIRNYIREMEKLNPFYLGDSSTRKRARGNEDDDDEYAPTYDRISSIRSRADFMMD